MSPVTCPMPQNLQAVLKQLLVYVIDWLDSDTYFTFTMPAHIPHVLEGNFCKLFRKHFKLGVDFEGKGNQRMMKLTRVFVIYLII
jgi:hypothetical protein